MNHMVIEAEKPVVLESLADEKSFDSAQVLIRQTRRINYIVFLPIFLNTVKNALKEGIFVIEVNAHRNTAIATIKKLRTKTGNMTLHNGPITTTVKMDLVYGPSHGQIKTKQQVDIWGAFVNAKGDLAINADPEVMVWAERVRNLHSKTHYPCIKTGCYMTFDVNLAYNRKYSCLVCQTDQCPKCQTAWCLHERMTCVQFKIRHEAEKLSDPYILEQLFSGELQACPKCSTLTHKVDGCNKITCESPGCGELWCWACGDGNLRTKHRDPYDHWSNKGCKVGSGIFAEDIGSIRTIRETIRDRNIVIFGEKIRPKPIGNIPKDLEERKVPAGLQTPPKAEAVGIGRRAPDAPRKLPLIRGNNMLGRVEPIAGKDGLMGLIKEVPNMDDNAWVPYNGPYRGQFRQILADPVQIEPKAAGFLGGNDEIPIPNNVRVGDFLRAIPAEFNDTDSDDDVLPDLVAERPVIVPAAVRDAQNAQEERQRRLGNALLRKPPTIQEITQDPKNAEERKQRAEELIRDAEELKEQIVRIEYQATQDKQDAIRNRNNELRQNAQVRADQEALRIHTRGDDGRNRMQPKEQNAAEQNELQNAQARVQNVAQNNQDALAQKRIEIIERMIADGSTEEEAADFMFALDTQMEADMALARQLQNED